MRRGARCQTISGSWTHDNHQQIKGIAWLDQAAIRAEPHTAFLLGDNYTDKYRTDEAGRANWGNQAEEAGHHDRKNVVGITTTFGSMGDGAARDPKKFKDLMDKEFQPLEKFVKRGGTVKFPVRDGNILNTVGNPPEYFKHNLGTGLADMDPNMLPIIQAKLDELASIVPTSTMDPATNMRLLQEDLAAARRA
ncbi:MAG: hypothetical protein ACI9S8_002750 [Chlamydiales bacterium]|jgi:hypothetical protein